MKSGCPVFPTHHSNNMKMKEQNQIEIYKAPDGSTQIKVQFELDTVWLTQSQMAELFQKDIRTISEHIQNVYSTEKLLASSTLRKFRIVGQEGKRQETRNIDYYNLTTRPTVYMACTAHHPILLLI